MQRNPPRSTRAARRHAARVLLASCTAFAAGAQAGELTIAVSGIAPGAGKVFVAVYDRAETFPIQGRQLAGQMLSPTDAQQSVHFKDLPPGQYAAVAFQDTNGNGELDKNFLGIPKEPYGFSNAAHGVTGPPKFSEAAFTLNPDGTARIELK